MVEEVHLYPKTTSINLQQVPGNKVWSQGREKYTIASMCQTLDDTDIHPGRTADGDTDRISSSGVARGSLCSCLARRPMHPE